jgi:GntR family transcriptional regulator / MocR family aminotransferase
VDLHLEVDLAQGRRAGIERAVRQAIRDGPLGRGTRLLSTRQLAEELGVARGTVVEAYDQLAIEGYLDLVHGGGTIVAHTPTEVAGPPRHTVPAAPDAYRLPSEMIAWPRFDLRPGAPDPASFPAPAWISATRRALRAAPLEAFNYGDPRGRVELRAALAHYLGRARGVVADPECIVICSGYSQALATLTRLLVSSNRPRIAMEDPSVPVHCRIVEDNGGEIIAVPVDRHGIDVGQLRSAHAHGVVVTPAHQFPLGAALAPVRRAELARWARQADAVVIEDDYDGEFRFDRQPVGAMQALDPDHIVYAGTASKSLSPALRMGWVVLSGRLVEPFLAARGPETVPTIDQLALAEFINSHALERHLRRMRAAYRRRRDALAEVLAASLYDLGLEGVSAGLHAVVNLENTSLTETDLLGLAASGGVGIHTLGDYWITPRDRQGIVVGYSRPPLHQYAAALAAFVSLLAPSRASATR